MKMVYALEENAWLIYEDLHGRLFVACTVDNYGELCITAPWNFTAKQSPSSHATTVHTCFTLKTSIPLTNSAPITVQKTLTNTCTGDKQVLYPPSVWGNFLSRQLHPWWWIATRCFWGGCCEQTLSMNVNYLRLDLDAWFHYTVICKSDCVFICTWIAAYRLKRMEASAAIGNDAALKSSE